MKIVVEDSNINNKSFLCVYDGDNKGKLPVVILVHAFGKSKESVLCEAYKLARNIIFVITFDLYMHGLEKNENMIVNKVSMNEVPKIIKESDNMLSELIDKYENCNIDKKRIGLAGISLGGNIVFDYISLNNFKVKAAVTIISTPAWAYNLLEMIKYYPETKEILNKQVIWARENEPTTRIKKLMDFPLLILSSVDDSVFSINETREVYKYMKMQYSEKAKIKMVEYNEMGHEYNEEMIYEMISWFKKYL